MGVINQISNDQGSSDEKKVEELNKRIEGLIGFMFENNEHSSGFRSDLENRVAQGDVPGLEELESNLNYQIQLRFPM